MKWSERAWEAAAPIYERILELPFMKDLTAGTLPVDRFTAYIKQDILYLKNYTETLTGLSALIEDERQKALFSDFALGGLEGERALHELLRERFSMGDDPAPLLKVTRDYCDFAANAVASGCREIALAAVLPCDWVYARVGQHVLENANLADNPYAWWIEQYADEGYQRGVQELIALADSWAEASGPEICNDMVSAFCESTQFEHDFWLVF